MESGVGCTLLSGRRPISTVGARLLSTLTPTDQREAFNITILIGGAAGAPRVPNAQDNDFPSSNDLPVGTALKAESTGQRSRFTRKIGLPRLPCYAASHYYANRGRFTQVDPIGISPGMSSLDPQTSTRTDKPTDRMVVGFFSFLKKLFKVSARIFRQSGRAIAKVGNNRWGCVTAGSVIKGFRWFCRACKQLGQSFTRS